MRYLIDTNILMFSIIETDKLDNNTLDIVSDPSNTLYVSTVSIREFIHLYKIGKIKLKRGVNLDILRSIKDQNFEILPVKEEHLRTYTKLSPIDKHNDPNDHVIISQAIAQKLPLISSDTKFKDYINQGLDHIYNNPRG